MTSTEGETSFKVLPIAGYENALGGGSKDVTTKLLKSIDPSTEGVRVQISGGNILEPDLKKKYPASAIIDFQCDPDRTGLEGLKNDDELDKVPDSAQLKARGDAENKIDGDEKNGDDKPKTASLTFKSFGLVKEEEAFILRLDWRTQHACENYKRENPEPNSSGGHWGFFTWLIIM